MGRIFTRAYIRPARLSRAISIKNIVVIVFPLKAELFTQDMFDFRLDSGFDFADGQLRLLFSEAVCHPACLVQG